MHDGLNERGVVRNWKITVVYCSHRYLLEALNQDQSLHWHTLISPVYIKRLDYSHSFLQSPPLYPQ